MMDFLYALPDWLGQVTVIAGLILIVFGVRGILELRREKAGAAQEINQILWFVRGGRWVLFGIGTVMIGVGWLTATPWVAYAGLAIALEELYETSMAQAILEECADNEEKYADSKAAGSSNGWSKAVTRSDPKWIGRPQPGSDSRIGRGRRMLVTPVTVVAVPQRVTLRP